MSTEKEKIQHRTDLKTQAIDPERPEKKENQTTKTATKQTDEKTNNRSSRVHYAPQSNSKHCTVTKEAHCNANYCQYPSVEITFRFFSAVVHAAHDDLPP